MDTLKQERVVSDPGDQCVDGFAKLAPKTGATRFVPSVHGNYVVLGLWPEYDFSGHELPQ